MNGIRALGIVAVVAIAGLALSGCQAVVSTSDSNKATASSAKVKAALPASIKAQGYITLADSGSVKPLKYTEPGSDQIIGLVPDLTNEYAARLGLKAKIDLASGDAVVPGVVAGRYDAGLALGDFAARRTQLVFVDILKGGEVLLVKKGNPEAITGISDLCGHSVAIETGSNEQEDIAAQQKKCAAAGKPAIQVQAYADGTSGALALQSGRVQSYYDDISDADYLIKENPKLYETTGGDEWLAPYGVGILKSDHELAVAIQKAVQSMVDDGSYQKILAKYGESDIALSKITINGSKF